MMDANEYQYKAMRTNKIHPDKEKDLMIALMGLAGEVGEVLEHVKKWQEGKRPLVIESAVEEVGDVIWYCVKTLDALSRLNGRYHNLADVLISNIEKLEERHLDGLPTSEV